MRGSLFARFVIVGAAVFARSHRVDVADVDAFVAELMPIGPGVICEIATILVNSAEVIQW